MTTRSEHDEKETMAMLSALAEAARPAVHAPESLAETVLTQVRRTRRTRGRRAALGLSGVVVVGTLAAMGMPGRSDFFDAIQPSPAMEPTVHVHDKVVFDKRLTPGRGDVVYVTLRVDGETVNTIKRVVGVAGDRVGCVADGNGECPAIQINGRDLIQPYLPVRKVPGFATQTVPAGHLFLLGDNLGLATDSRILGPADARAVKGVGVEVVDPGNKARAIPGAPPHPGPNGNVDPATGIPTARAVPTRR